MINLGQNNKKVAVFHNQPNPVVFDNGKLEHITLLFCVSAASVFMKPLAILPLKCMPDLPEDIMSNFDITGNDSGWITGEILKNWVENQFVNEVKRLRNFYRKDEPALVLLDGHSSRNSIDLEFMWQQHRIAFYLLPPHSSHLIQPLDRTCNGVFKTFLQNDCHLELTDNTHERRIKVLRSAATCADTALSSYYNMRGWRHAGLEPYNPDRILLSGLVKNNKLPKVEEEEPKKKKRRTKFNSQIVSNGVLTVPFVTTVAEL